MALSPAKRKSNDKWIKENYKQVKLSMPNEEAELLEQHCTIYQHTKAGFIREAIQEKIQRDVSTMDTPPPKKESLPPKGKLTPSVLLAEDGKRDTGTSTGKDRPLEESDLLPWEGEE